MLNALRHHEERLEPAFQFFVGKDKEFEFKISAKESPKQPHNAPKKYIKLSAEEATLLWLFEEYMSLYKHFDNLRHHFASVLILVTAGLSYVPQLTQIDATTSSRLTIASTIAILVLAGVGAMANRKLRFRMKNFYHRCNIILEQLFGEDAINELKKESKRRTAAEISNKDKEFYSAARESEKDALARAGLEQLKAMEGVTRGLIWYTIPWLVGIYALVFLSLEIWAISNSITHIIAIVALVTGLTVLSMKIWRII